MGKFKVSTDAAGKYRFNLVADNGQVVLSSQGYAGKDGCMNGIDSVRKNCGDDACFERAEASNGKVYFNLKATNGQVIGTSQMYADKGGMENGIASVAKNAPDAAVEEE